MRFEYYHPGLENMPKLSADGIVPNSIHLSHWQGNHTDAALKADTSTEIALNFVSARRSSAITEQVDIVTNNHFDTDGVLSVWTLLNGNRASLYRIPLIAAAEAGDFSAYAGDDAVRMSILIQGAHEAPPRAGINSPLANKLAGSEVLDEALAYKLVLPEVEQVITQLDRYQDLWRDGWLRIAVALESFSSGESTIDEIKDINLSVIHLSPGIFSPHGFNPTRHGAPFTAMSANAKGQVYLIITPLGERRWSYRVDYAYHSWAETVVRPHIKRRNFRSVVDRLNELERMPQGCWAVDSSELSSALKFVDSNGTTGASNLAPEIVASELRKALRETQAAQGAGDHK